MKKIIRNMKEEYLTPKLSVHNITPHRIWCGSASTENFSENKDSENVDDWEFDD